MSSKHDEVIEAEKFMNACESDRIIRDLIYRINQLDGYIELSDKIIEGHESEIEQLKDEISELNARLQEINDREQ